MNKADKLFQLLLAHIAAHPGMEVQDVYKLLYQGVFGGEHLLQDAEKAKSYLEQEWNSVEPNEHDYLVEPVDVDANVVRVNLRTFKNNEPDWQKLWDVFYNSAKHVNGDKGSFVELLDIFIQFCENQVLPFDYNIVQNFCDEMKVQEYPAKHHSQNYKEMNKPAYRIVLKSELEKAGYIHD